MSVDNFIPTLWTADLLKSLETAHVFAQVTNRDHEGELTGVGDTVKINAIGPITVNDYTGSVSYEELTDASMTLTADQDKYWAFEVGDLDEIQAKANLRAEAMEEASYGVADKVDAYIEGLRSDAGLSYSNSSPGSGDVHDILSGIRKKLMEKDVPKNFPLFLCIEPAFDKLITEADINNATDNTETISQGYVGNYMGFDVYTSNNMTSSRAMAGTYRAIAFAETFTKTEALRGESSFKDKIRGRHIYGGKVLRPDELVNVDFS